MSAPAGRSTSSFDGDETRVGVDRARAEQEDSFQKLLRALRAHPEPKTHAPLVATLARWATFPAVLREIVAFEPWFDEWEVREALFGNAETEDDTRDRIAAGLAIFELVRELDRPGVDAEAKTEIRDEIKSQISFLPDHDKELVRARLKTLAGKKPAAPVAPAESPAAESSIGTAAEPIPSLEAPPAAAPAGVDPTLLALFADLQSTVATHDRAVAALEAATPAVVEPEPDAALSMFGFDEERISGVVERPEPPLAVPAPPTPPPPPPRPVPPPPAPPPVEVPFPPTPGTSPAMPPVAAPAVPPLAPPAAEPAPEEPQYIIVGGEIVSLVDGLDAETIRRRMAAGSGAAPEAPAVPAEPPVSPPPAPPADEIIFIEEVTFLDEAPAPPSAPPPPPSPPPAPAVTFEVEAPPAPPPAPTQPAARKFPALGPEEKAELARLPLPEKISMASMTDRLDVLGALLRAKEDRVVETALDNPNLPEELLAMRAREFPPAHVGILLKRARWKKNGRVLVGLLSNLVITRPAAIEILKSMEAPSDLLGVMRSPDVMNPQLKQMAKDRLVERYWAMPVRHRVSFLQAEGNAVFQDLWEQVFRDEETLKALIDSGALDEASAMKIATSPLAPRGVLEALGGVPALRKIPALVEAIIKSPKTPKSTAAQLAPLLPPDARERLKRSISLSPAVRALLG